MRDNQTIRQTHCPDDFGQGVLLALGEVVMVGGWKHGKILRLHKADTMCINRFSSQYPN